MAIAIADLVQEQRHDFLLREAALSQRDPRRATGTLPFSMLLNCYVRPRQTRSFSAEADLELIAAVFSVQLQQRYLDLDKKYYPLVWTLFYVLDAYDLHRGIKWTRVMSIMDLMSENTKMRFVAFERKVVIFNVTH